MAIDPICGMRVEPAHAAGEHEHNGQIYYFCSQHCLAKFKENPPEYVKTAASSQVADVEQPSGQKRSITDPVCDMTVDPSSAAGKHEYKGKTYYFCSHHCAQKFKEDPDKWLDRQRGRYVVPTPAREHTASRTHVNVRSDEAAYVCPMDPEVRESKPGACPKCGMALEPAHTAAAATRVEYVCPMHPEIVRDEPGSCPICGMALEPRTVTLEDAPNPELVHMTRRFWVSAALSLPLLTVAMSDMISGQPLQHMLSPRLLTWLQFVLATPVVLWGGWPFFERG